LKQGRWSIESSVQDVGTRWWGGVASKLLLKKVYHESKKE